MAHIIAETLKSLPDLKQYIEETMLSKIPLLASMKAKVARLNDFEFSIEAPLDPNKNHLMSAFGGSIAALATAAGWGMLMGELKKGNVAASVVVVKNSIKYLQPVMNDFIASCRKESVTQWSGFMEKLKSTSHSKIKLYVHVMCDEEVCAILEGTFLARLV